MRNLAAFAFGVFVAVVWGIAQAETIPATLGYSQSAPSGYENMAGQVKSLGEHTAICVALGPKFGANYTAYVEDANGLNKRCMMRYPDLHVAQVDAYTAKCASGQTVTTKNGVLACWTTAQVYTCPTNQNWTVNGSNCTRPDCVAPEVRQENGTCAPPPCVPGAVVSSGFYDMGVTAAGFNNSISVCANGCNATFYGYAPYGTSLVNGTTHFWAKGEYRTDPGPTGTGTTCNASTAPTQSAGIAPDTCAANQGKATMNGKTVCINTTTGQPANTNGAAPDTTPKPGNGSTTSTTTDPNTGSKTTTTTTTAPDGSTSVVTTTCDSSGGNCSSSTTNTPGAGGGTGAWTGSSSGSGSGGGSGSGAGDANGDGVADDPTGTTDDATSDYCAENPSSQMCAEIKAGAGAGTDNLYTKGTRTATDVFNDFGNKVKGAGFYSAATNYFSASVPSGSCSGLSQSFDFGGGQSVTIDLDSIFCGSTAAAIFSILGYGLMLAASWTAFRIAIL